IASIRDAKDASGKDVFTKEEKSDYFFDYLINTETARDVAKVLVKIKGYEKIKSPNLALVGELETERIQNTVTYRVLNKKYLMDNLNRIGGSDLPKDKAARETKIKEYEVEVAKLQGEQAPGEKRIINLRTQRARLEEEKEIDINGKEKSLNDTTLTVKYKDYDNSLGEDYKSNKGLFRKDSDGNEDAIQISTGVSVENAVKKANMWNNKNNVTSSYDDYGFSYLARVLREIGAEKLKEIVDKSSPRNLSKTLLKEYAEEITKFVNYTEIIANDNTGPEKYGDDFDNEQ
ncbi:13983_t:CDS:2, partial [Funneliformis geosporum]